MQARRILTQLDERTRREYVAPLDSAYVLAGLGEHDAAVQRLEQAAQDHAVWMRNINIDPRFKPLLGHPRFRVVLRKLNLPD
ncbi:MAG TPA: hypothetical protein VGA40_08925 [Candidatus Acidoferrales bacterium]